MAHKMEKLALGLVDLEASLGKEQISYFKKNGYTFLSSEQMRFLDVDKDESKLKTSRRRKKRNLNFATIEDNLFPKIADLMEDEIESYIGKIASHSANSNSNLEFGNSETLRKIMSTHWRQKRQLSGTFLGLPIQGPVVGILAPFAFVPQVNSLQLFTLYVLSPQAFIPSFQNPAMFYVQLLTPWAFLANYASPQAFTCLCLSPVFFEANLFSPQFFYLELLSPTMMQANLLGPYFFLATILSPQVMIADLLNPNFFQYKIFSDQIGLATLLSPNIGSPNIFSNQSHFFEVLSPSIASPNIHSTLKNSILILSPEILGGHGGERGFETEGENVITIPDEDHPEAGNGEHAHGKRK